LLESTRRRLSTLLLVGAPLLFVASFLLMLARVEPFYHWFYCFAWWTFIPFVSACNYRRRGRSLVLTETRELLWMIPVSAAVWFLFELFNLRLQNWGYIGVPEQRWLRWPGYFLAFGSVLPGIFETSQLWMRRPLWHRQHRDCPPPSSCVLFSAIGLALTACALIWPLYCFPLVWVTIPWIFDPWLCRAGRPSLTADLRAGDWSRIGALLLGGLICGGVWEFWNFWAGAKWVYSVPWIGTIKLFEMPVLGFGGFPPFALECFVLYQGYRWLVEGPARSKTRRVFLALAALALCAISIYGIDHYTVRVWE